MNLFTGMFNRPDHTLIGSSKTVHGEHTSHFVTRGPVLMQEMGDEEGWEPWPKRYPRIGTRKMTTSHFKKHPKKMAAQENGQRRLCIAPTKYSRGYACPLHSNDNQGES